jgi:hypothetical protein
VGLAVFIVIAVVIVVFLFAQRLNARRLLREDREQAPPEVRDAPTESERPSASATEDIAARIEDEAERMGIRVSPEDVQQIARQIRDAQDSEPDAPLAATPTIPAAGARAHAVVVTVPGATVPVTLDVEAPGGSTRRITVQVPVPSDRWSALASGTRLPVTVDPDDPTSVSIDWDGA